MRRYSLVVVTILMLGLVMPIVPFAISSYGSGENVDAAFVENTSLAANGESAITVIKVSDDAPVQDSSPNTNFDDDSGAFNLDCSNWSGSITRSWLKFNLTHLPNNLHFTRATVNLFTVSSVGSADYPRGVYLSENDTWTEETITWNNQPEYSAVPSAVIDSPASPDMFDVGLWYEWEITAEVVQTLEQDGILTLVLSMVDEDASVATNLAFSSREYAIVLGELGYNDKTPSLSLEYAVPTTTELLVDGVSESPQIDYINSANPDFSWTFNDVDPDDFQKNYELEVWNNSAFDDTLLMQERNSEVAVVHDTGGTGTSVADVFNAPFEVRSQYKWPSSMIPQSGVVDKLYFEMDALSGITTFSDLAIYLVSVEESSDLSTDFQSNYDGRTPIQVLNRSEFTAINENGYIAFDIENTFVVHSSMNLIIEFRTTGSVGTSNSNFTDSGGSYASKIGSG
ncbi:MAG: CBM96 family carbohydrate-binding protein, partial [Candidatus Thorarchaeota archaeon]